MTYGKPTKKKEKALLDDVGKLSSAVAAMTTAAKSKHTTKKGKVNLIVSKRTKRRINEYLLCLIDPFNHSYFIPDKYVGMTKVFTQELILELDFDAAMEAVAHIFPSLGLNAIVTKGGGGQFYFVFTPLTLVGDYVVENGRNFGMDMRGANRMNALQIERGGGITKTVLAGTDQYWRISPAVCTNACKTLGTYWEANRDNYPNQARIEFAGNVANNITFEATWVQPAVAAETIFFHVVTNLGIRTGTAVLATTQTSCVVTVTLQVGDTKITSFGVGVTGSYKSITAIYTSGYLDTSDVTGNAEMHSVPEFSKITGDYLEARCVGMAAWFEPTMASLDNGGELACKLVEGGSDTNFAHYSTFNDIAGANASVTKKIKTGAYAVWRPTVAEDYKFKGVFAADSVDLTHISCAMKVSKAAGESMLLKVASVWEGKTNERYLGPSNSTMDIQMMEDATNKLNNFPLIMENDTHLQKIHDWLKGTANVSGKIGQIVGGATLALSPFTGPLAPAIAGGGAALVGAGTALAAL